MIESTPELEATFKPTEELFAAMGRYNEELAEAGIMLSGEGLVPSSKGKMVHFSPFQRKRSQRY